jgi:cell wall assembly regulator SMI1
MSKITEALDKISFWIENSESAHALFIKNGTLGRFYPLPGLEKEMIKLYVEEINFNMPEEVYDLYQWHDGEFEVGNYANPVVFQPFDQAFF